MSVANSYTATPGIVPGPLTVNGPLTINNDCGITLGGSSPFVRVFKNGGIQGIMSYNLGCDSTTRDNAAVAARALRLRSDGFAPDIFELNPAGTAFLRLLDHSLAISGTVVGNTGNVTENTIKSRIIFGNTLDAHSSLIVEVAYNAAVQGATATTLRLRFGGVVVANFTKAVTGLGAFRFVLWNAGATNAQNGEGYAIDTAAATVVAGFAGLAIDTTVDQTLAWTVQNGAPTDSFTTLAWRVHAATSRVTAQ